MEQERLYSLYYMDYFSRMRGETERTYQNIFVINNNSSILILIDDVEAIQEEMDFQVPKYLLCNKKRFPYWFGNKDTRLNNFRRILGKIQNQYNLSKLDNPMDCQNLFTKKYLFVNESVYQIVPSCHLN